MAKSVSVLCESCRFCPYLEISWKIPGDLNASMRGEPRRSGWTAPAGRGTAVHVCLSTSWQNQILACDQQPLGKVILAKANSCRRNPEAFSALAPTSRNIACLGLFRVQTSTFCTVQVGGDLAVDVQSSACLALCGGTLTCRYPSTCTARKTCHGTGSGPYTPGSWHQIWGQTLG